MIEERPKILSNHRRVGLVCKPNKPEIELIAAEVTDYLLSKNIEVFVDSGSCNVSEKEVTPTMIEEFDVDFVITIGGDGTILHTLRHLSNRETPLFCINRGTVGLLTESSAATAISSLGKIIENDCIIERCVNLTAGVRNQTFGYALNEVLVASCVPGRLLTFQVSLDGSRIASGRGDGCMVSTPCGSTAYALSAGGSILTPGIHGLIFVPVCPPRFELKPIVIPDTSILEIEMVKQGLCCLAVLDGQRRHEVESNEVVWIKKAEQTTRFIRLYDNYYDRLNTRLKPRTL